MLREYTSVPSTVLACKIEEDGEIEKVSEGKTEKGTYEYRRKGSGAARTKMVFEASVVPKAGDFIIQQSKDDIYHCPEELFAKKYNVKGMYIR